MPWREKWALPHSYSRRPRLNRYQGFLGSNHKLYSKGYKSLKDPKARLLVTLSYFRPDRFVQLLSLIPILILLLYLLVSIDLEYTGLLLMVSWRKQLGCKLNSICSGAEITSNFSTYKYVGCLLDGVWLVSL